MRTLHTVKEKNKILNDFVVFDTETKGLRARPDAFIFGVIYTSEFTKVLYSVDEFIKEFQKPFYHKKKVFAHNAEFDLNVIYGNIYDIDLKAIFNGRFIAANNDNCMFADSMNIYPASVKRIGEIINLNKLEIQAEYIKGSDNIKVTHKMIKYCIRDCEIVYRALLEIFEKVGNIKITLAGLSLDFFRRYYLDFHIDFNEFSDEFFDSYFGGRTEAFKIGNVNACAYDINSMYPYAMKNAVFPNPKYLKKMVNVKPEVFINHYLKHFEGMAKMTIVHKEHYFGHLPIRDKGKLLFPIGEFSGYWNFNELRYAIDKGLIEIKKVDYVVYSNRMKSPFIKFVDQLYLERKTDTNELNKLILKLLLNSLYGKFGQKIKNEYMYIPDMYRMADEIAAFKRKGILIKIVAFSEDRTDCFVELRNKRNEKTYNSIPVFSSYITSFSRIMLLDYLCKYWLHKPIYCDTDSIFFEQDPQIPESSELGKWKKEEKTVVEIRGLKNYSYIANNKKIDKIKGVPKNSIKIDFNKYEYENLLKTREALVRNMEPGQLIKRRKELKHNYDKRIVLKGGETLPYKL